MTGIAAKFKICKWKQCIFCFLNS